MLNGGCVVVGVIVVGAVIFSIVCFYFSVVPLTHYYFIFCHQLLLKETFSTVTGRFLVTTNISGTGSHSSADFVMVFLVLAR